jgi:hypothetical protein
VIDPEYRRQLLDQINVPQLLPLRTLVESTGSGLFGNCKL